MHKSDFSEKPKIGEVRCCIAMPHGTHGRISGSHHVRIEITSMSKSGLKVEGNILKPGKRIGESVKVSVENLFPLTHKCDFD